jgi:hypothetical protein
MPKRTNDPISRRQFLDVLAKTAITTAAFTLLPMTKGSAEANCTHGGGNGHGPSGPGHGPNPYNPYNPYSPYKTCGKNPYHPYNPYNPYNAYSPYNPYSPYSSASFARTGGAYNPFGIH